MLNSHEVVEGEMATKAFSASIFRQIKSVNCKIFRAEKVNWRIKFALNAMDGGGNFCRGIRSDANFQFFFANLFFLLFLTQNLFCFNYRWAGPGRAGAEVVGGGEIKFVYLIKLIFN